MREEVREGTVLFASDDSDQSIQEAREYIREKRLTGDDCRIIRKAGSVMVVAKRSPESWRTHDNT